MSGEFMSLRSQAVALLLLVAGLLNACSSGGPVGGPDPHLGVVQASHADTGTASPKAVSAAISADGAELQIRYLEDGREASARALIPPQVEPASAPVTPDLTLPMTPAPPDFPAGARTVAVRSVADWQALVRNLVMEALGLVPGRGVVLDLLRHQELFLFIDEQGILQALPLAEKPADVEPALVLGLGQLLDGAHERVRREVPGSSHLLFNTGDPVYPFALLLFERPRSLFLGHPSLPESSNASNAPAHTVQAAYHALTSGMRGLATDPVSTLGRLLSGIGTTAVDTLPRLRRWDQAEPPPMVTTGAVPMDPVAWEQKLDALVPDSATHGRIDYLVDGRAFFPALIHEISAAQEAVRIRLYIFDNDDYALRIADQLKARSAEVSVEVLLDGLGTITGGMAQAETLPAASVPGPVSIAAYLREDSRVKVRMLPNPWMQGDHSKVLVFDDRIAFMGGMNIGREYRYEWHDLMVALEGPVTDRLINDFEKAWRRAAVLGGLAALADGGQPVRDGGPDDYPLRLLYTRPGDSQILRAQLAALRDARQRVWIQNAYLTSDLILDELIAARRRGVDVRVILPYRNDAGFIGRSNVLAANLMLSHGIRVYIYPGMSHVKAAVYDGWACLGSANFDRLSLRLNRETNIGTSHPEAVERLVAQVFAPDFERALELSEPLPSSWLDYLKEMIADQL
jgi:cardiolipin synthase